MHQQEVPNGIDPLDRVSIPVIGSEEPRVVDLDEIAGRLLSPQLRVICLVSLEPADDEGPNAPCIPTRCSCRYMSCEHDPSQRAVSRFLDRASYERPGG